MVGTDWGHICCTDVLQRNQLYVNRNTVAVYSHWNKYYTLTHKIKIAGLIKPHMVHGINPNNAQNKLTIIPHL
jgi:hypothetical protein